MSLILDALKKLDQDKAARRGKSTEIGPAILKGTPRRSSFRPVVATLAALAVLAVVALAVKVFFFSAPAPTSPIAAPKESTPAAPAPVTPPAPAAATPALPAPEAKPLAATLTAMPQPPAAPAAAPPQPQSAAAPANLKVTGIAWQDERRSRRAVVNGMLVGEGSFIAGARVTEIRLDRVRFTLDGQEVTAPLLTPLNAEAPADKGTGTPPNVAPPASPTPPAAVTAAPANPAPPGRSQRPRRHYRNPNDYEP